MSLYQTQDCDDKCQDHTLRRQLLYDKPGKIPAKMKNINIINIIFVFANLYQYQNVIIIELRKYTKCFISQ